LVPYGSPEEIGVIQLAWLGDFNFYDESNMVAPGCVYSQIIESNGETTPKK